jgi:hypothetical protein
MKPTHFSAAMALAITALPAAAQTQAPGLWEHAFSMKSAGGEIEKAMAEMKKQLDAMPPDQRQQMEQMMASRGVKMGAQGSSVKFCLTKEQAARPAEPRVNEHCTQQVEQRSGNTVRFKFECTRPEGASGEGEMTYLNDKAYTGKTHLTAQVNGKPQQMSLEMTGKWLGSDCGDVKPLAMPAK